MKLQTINVAYLWVLCISVAISAVTVFFWPPNLNYFDTSAQITSFRVEGFWTRTYGIPHYGSEAGRAEVEWEILLNYPKRAPVNSTVLVETQPRIVQIDTYGLDFMQGYTPVPQGITETEIQDDVWINLNNGSTPPPSPPPWAITEKEIKDDVWNDLENGLIALELNISGAEVSPRVLSCFSRDQLSAWSVNLPKTGRQRGVVTASYSRSYKWIFKFVGDPTVDILVYEPLFTTRNILAVIAVLLGPLVSIPGIIAFLRERRKDREKQQKLEEAQKTQPENDSPNIIIP